MYAPLPRSTPPLSLSHAEVAPAQRNTKTNSRFSIRACGGRDGSSHGRKGFAALDSEEAAEAKPTCGVSVLEAPAAVAMHVAVRADRMVRKSEQALGSI